MVKLSPVIGAMIAASPALASGQQTSTTPATSPEPCSATEYHQFDFWMGRWDVYDRAGTLVAHSLVEPVYGCGIREKWMPLGKQGGTSLSIYVPAERHWEQFWIDAAGSRALFTGKWNGASMVITGKWAGPLVRMTYSKNADGTVRQLGQQSIDGGRTWTPSFDFFYRPSGQR